MADVEFYQTILFFMAFQVQQVIATTKSTTEMGN